MIVPFTALQITGKVWLPSREPQPSLSLTTEKAVTAPRLRGMVAADFWQRCFPLKYKVLELKRWLGS